MGARMIVGELSTMLEDAVGFLDHSIILEAAAEYEVEITWSNELSGSSRDSIFMTLKSMLLAHILGLPLRNVKQELMLPFWQAGKGTQPTICGETFNKRRGTKVAQQEGPGRCLKCLATRGCSASAQVQQIKKARQG